MRSLLACAAAIGILLAGCGDSKTDQMVRTGTVAVAAKPDGTLTSNPAPLTVADIEHQPEGSARQAVMQLLFWAQWGNVPGLVASYDAIVTSELGASTVAGAYDLLRSELLTSKLRIVTSRRSGGGEFVAIELASTRGAPMRESFVLRRHNGFWRVVYDTLLRRGVQASAVHQAEPGNATPSAAATRLGLRAALKYMDVYISEVVRERRR